MLTGLSLLEVKTRSAVKYLGDTFLLPDGCPVDDPLVQRWDQNIRNIVFLLGTFEDFTSSVWRPGGATPCAALTGQIVITSLCAHNTAHHPLSEFLMEGRWPSPPSPMCAGANIAKYQKRYFMIWNSSAICHNMPAEDMKICPFKGEVLRQSPFDGDSQVVDKSSKNLNNEIDHAMIIWRVGMAWETADSRYVRVASVSADLFKNSKNLNTSFPRILTNNTATFQQYKIVNYGYFCLPNLLLFPNKYQVVNWWQDVAQ